MHNEPFIHGRLVLSYGSENHLTRVPWYAESVRVLILGEI